MNPDDTMDTLDTTLDFTALDTEVVEGLDTEQIPALDPEELDVTALTAITGGMRWQEFRRSTNVEDRRGPKAIARDQQWWDRSNAPASVPLPRSRPEGI
jgi:hypothetical protein